MNTRATAIQQEHDGQFAKLLEMMEQQQQRQEQLATEHRAQLQELGQWQQQRLETIMREQHQQWETVKARQRATEEKMDSVYQDMETTKTVMEDRMHDAEQHMVELRTSHHALTEEILTNQRAFREEVQAELRDQKMDLAPTESREPESTMRTSATEFIPSTISRPTGMGLDPGPSGSRSGSSAVPRPPTYDGRSEWEAYRTQFEMLAQVNTWTEPEKATFLAVSLRGTALTVLLNLSPERHHEYKDLVAALQKRFGSAHQAELHRMKLKSRSRRREESLPELLEDIERLARLAYPDAKPKMLEVLAKDQFIDALPDEDLRLRVRQNRPATLQQALETALELESYQLSNKQRRKTVREACLEQHQGDVNCEILEKLQECLNALQRRTGEVARRGGRQRRGSGSRRESRSPPRKPCCWNCGEPGHLRRDCKKPKLPSEPGNTGRHTTTLPGNAR